jgi:hypothetical protein
MRRLTGKRQAFSSEERPPSERRMESLDPGREGRGGREGREELLSMKCTRTYATISLLHSLPPSLPTLDSALEVSQVGADGGADVAVGNGGEGAFVLVHLGKDLRGELGRGGRKGGRKEE